MGATKNHAAASDEHPATPTTANYVIHVPNNVGLFSI
jgi:hypothetical protein